MTLIDYIASLPDSYQKHSKSNNYKLLSLEEKLVADLRSDVEAVDQTTNIYTATGKTLDLYGKIYGKPRGTATDEQYRFMILQRVAQTLTSGDYNGVVSSIAVIFGVPVTELRLQETDNICEIEVINLPYSVLINAGFTAQQTTDLVRSLLPAGISLAPLNLAGTFEFGDETNVATVIARLIALKDCERAVLRGLNVYGRTIRDGMPTPDAPVELVSAENPNVTICGKNFVPYPHYDTTKTMNGITFTDNGDGVITANGTASGDANYACVTLAYNTIPIKAGKYTISGCPSGGGALTYEIAVGYRETQDGTRQLNFERGNGLTVTWANDGYIDVICVVRNGMTVNNLVFKPQIELGDTATDFESYTKQPTLSVPYTLHGIPVESGGNFTDETGQPWLCDEVDFERGVHVKRLEAREFDGTETFHIISTLDDGLRVGFNWDGLMYPNSSLMCSHLPNQRAVPGITQGANASPSYYVPYSSLDEWAAYLAEQHANGTPMVVVVPLRAPIETPLSAEEIATYEALYTNDPNTVIHNDAAAPMKVLYVSSEKTLEYDEDAGFGNIEQTVGGYLGLLSEIKSSDRTD